MSGCARRRLVCPTAALCTMDLGSLAAYHDRRHLTSSALSQRSLFRCGSRGAMSAGCSSSSRWASRFWARSLRTGRGSSASNISWDTPGSAGILIVYFALGGGIACGIAGWIAFAFQIRRWYRRGMRPSSPLPADDQRLRVALAIAVIVGSLFPRTALPLPPVVTRRRRRAARVLARRRFPVLVGRRRDIEEMERAPPIRSTALAAAGRRGRVGTAAERRRQDARRVARQGAQKLGAHGR